MVFLGFFWWDLCVCVCVWMVYSGLSAGNTITCGICVLATCKCNKESESAHPTKK